METSNLLRYRHMHVMQHALAHSRVMVCMIGTDASPSRGLYSILTSTLVLTDKIT